MAWTNRMNFGAHRAILRQLATATLSVAALVAGSVQAQSGAVQGEGTTRQEMALLPAYCPHAAQYARIFGTPEGRATWEARLGTDFKHIHHYCWALVALQRANRATSTTQERRSYLGAAERDISYVIRHGSREFILMPELYLRRGQTRLRLSREQEAMQDFQQAIALRPDYSPPYVEIAELLKRQSKHAEARKILEKGLEHAPDSKYLQNARAQLGPLPAAVRESEPARERAAAAPASAAEKEAAQPESERDPKPAP